MQKRFILINKKCFDRFIPITELSEDELFEILKELKDSSTIKTPKDYEIFLDYGENIIDLCRKKAIEDINSLQNNLSSLIKKNDWLNTLSTYVFEFKVNLFLKELWFLPRRIEIDEDLEKELMDIDQQIIKEIKNYNSLKEYSFLSDGNINYFEFPFDKYDLEKKINIDNKSVKFKHLLSAMSKIKSNTDFKLLLEITY